MYGLENIDDRILSGNIEGLSHDTFERIYKQIDDVSLSPKSKKGFYFNYSLLFVLFDEKIYSN